MKGKHVGIAILAAAAVAGGAIFYLQEYYYYTRLGPDAVEIRLTNDATGAAEPLVIEAVSAIDAESSPIRFRACFTTAASQETLSATYRHLEGAKPLNGPRWFDCFDAGEIDRTLHDGSAIAYMGEENITYGIDRIVAIMEDGRGFAWQQVNECGERQYDGTPVRDDCPTPEDQD
jgi:hypothetical protein